MQNNVLSLAFSSEIKLSGYRTYFQHFGVNSCSLTVFLCCLIRNYLENNKSKNFTWNILQMYCCLFNVGYVNRKIISNKVVSLCETVARTC